MKENKKTLVRFNVQNIKYATPDATAPHGWAKPLPYGTATKMALESDSSVKKIFGDGRRLCAIVNDKGKTGTMSTNNVNDEYEIAMGRKKRLKNGLADIKQKCLSDIKQICGELGIKLNTKKTQIVKISRGITFLQRRFVLTETGKVIIKPRPRGIVKMRRKLRVFKRKLDAGKMAFADIKTSFVSFKGHLKHCNAHRIIVRLNALFDKIFYGRYNT